MNLMDEIEQARKEIFTDGYEMSIGEIASLYTNQELTINPAYQRLFRWDESRKTSFIESLLLGIPTPPIFVYQNDNGTWELIDGLQRLSTIFQFMGILQQEPQAGLLMLSGTKLLPSLEGSTWNCFSNLPKKEMTQSLRLYLKRSRIRVEILKKESDPNAKFEVFQRLNTGGLALSEQEVRDSVLIMLNTKLYTAIDNLANSSDFLENVSVSEEQISRGYLRELVLRFISYKNVPYQKGLDVHEYLGTCVVDIATNPNFDIENETSDFNTTFSFLTHTKGNAFKRFADGRFLGRFSLAAYEVISYGIRSSLSYLNSIPQKARDNFISSKIEQLWSEPTFSQYSGSGVRGTTRLINLLPFAEKYFSS